MPARVFVFAVLAAVGLALFGAARAGACSCADEDPRDKLERGDVAVVGQVMSSTDVEGFGTRYVLRVERALNARLGPEVAVLGHDFQSSCGFTWRVGQRVAAFLYRSRGEWEANLCTLSTPAEIERALTPYPRPLGEGRAALLAGGSFGDARLMALDSRGRVLGYGFGEGTVRSISVCPGAGAVAELVSVGRRRTLVAVRSLADLKVTSVAAVPGSTRHVACADAGGATVYAAGIGYKGRPLRGTGRVLRIAGGTATPVFTGPAEQIGLGPGAAYVWSARRLSAISLPGGESRVLVRMRLPEAIAASPDGRFVAVQGFDELLRVIDLAGGAGATKEQSLGWALSWIAPERLLVRVGSRAYVYDPQLGLRRRYLWFRAVHQAAFGGSLFGLDRYRLVRLDLDSGRRHTAGRLPDRGIHDLVGVEGAPPLEVSRRAPRRISGTGPRTRSARAGRRGARTARWTCARSRRG